jgi:protoporphyrinogen oxidase
MAEMAIIGAGMAGFGAAYRFSRQGMEATLYEKNGYHGGHSATFVQNGFTFDDGPHISFTKDKRLQELFARSVDHRFETVKAGANNFWKGHWVKHPAQCNLHGLPRDLVADIIVDFVQRDINRPVRNYMDWLYAGFGKVFAENFPMRYGLKFHTTTADNMSTEWVGPRLYQPDLKEIVYGALSPSTPDVHYVEHFRYPSKGGFVRFLDMFLPSVRMQLNRQVVGIDHGNQVLTFKDGSHAHYDSLISTAPLPELIPMIQGAPDRVRQAAENLACTSCILVNLGVDRPDISEAQWTYFYDKDFIFTRLSFPHMLSSHNAPTGAGSIQAEIYYSKKYKPMDRQPEACIAEVIADLKKCGLLTEEDNILFKEARVVPYANVIFDLDREPALKKVHDYLDVIGIGYAGRYGQWGYHWTDESFISGEQAAQSILDTL